MVIDDLFEGTIGLVGRVTTLLHDMMHQDVEVYVNDMIVKSQDRAD